MADTTWGVKVPEELKEKIVKAMQETDLSGKEFVETLLQAYELNMVKQTQPVLMADIEELQSLTSRINMIYVNAAERIENLAREKELQYQIQIESKDSVIRIYDAKNKELEQQIKELNDEKKRIEELNSELSKRNQELEEVGSTNKALVQEYKEKNDTLAGLLNEYKEYKTVNDSIKTQIENVRQQKIEAEKTIAELRKTIEELNQKINDVQVKHKDELERFTAKAELDMGKAILEIQNNYQGKISSLNEEYNSKISSLQHDYNSEVKSLLDRIDDLQTKLVEAKDKKANPDKKEKVQP